MLIFDSEHALLDFADAELDKAKECYARRDEQAGSPFAFIDHVDGEMHRTRANYALFLYHAQPGYPN